MALVRGLAATPIGKLPTGMVAATLQAGAVAGEVPAGAAGVAAAGTVARAASKAMAAIAKTTARWVNLTVSSLRTWQRLALSTGRCAGSGVCPSILFGAAPVKKMNG